MVHFEGTEAPIIPLVLQPQIHHPSAFNSQRETGITVLQNRGWNISQTNPKINPAPSGLSLQLCTLSHVIFRQHFPIYFLITSLSSSTQDIIPVLTHTQNPSSCNQVFPSTKRATRLWAHLLACLYFNVIQIIRASGKRKQNTENPLVGLVLLCVPMVTTVSIKMKHFKHK